MGSITTHALDRAIRQEAIHNVVDLEKRRAELGVDALQELEQQFQIAIEGTAGQAMAWSETEIDFDVEFYIATAQRDSPYTVPHFTYGAVVEGPSPVGVVACVRAWITDDREAVTGCRIAVGCIGDAEFAGYVHLVFQGYGAIKEEEADLDVGD